jgi:hypothetical protein
VEAKLMMVMAIASEAAGNTIVFIVLIVDVSIVTVT